MKRPEYGADSTAWAAYYMASNYADDQTVGGLADQVVVAYDRPLAENISIIPVAGEEWRWVGRLASLHAAQPVPEGGLTTVLGINGRPDQPIDPRTTAAAKEAQAAYPNLDLRWVDMGLISPYDEHGREVQSIMPKLRKDLVAAVIAALLRQTIRSEHILLHMNDIDPVYLSNGYYGAMRRAHLQNPRHMLVAKARHGYYENMPNLNAAIALSDLDGVFDYWPYLFEQATAISLLAYCKGDGYNDRRLLLGETIDLSDGYVVSTVEGAALVASGRRQAKRFTEGQGTIWPADNFELSGRSYRTEEVAEDIARSNMKKVMHYTFQDNELRYTQAITEAFDIMRGLDDLDTFEALRDAVWTWARQKVEDAMPRFADFQRFVRDADPIGFPADTAVIRHRLERMAHHTICELLLRQYGDKNLDELVQNGFQEVHAQLLSEWSGRLSGERPDRFAYMAFEPLVGRYLDAVGFTHKFVAS